MVPKQVRTNDDSKNDDSDDDKDKWLDFSIQQWNIHEDSSFWNLLK